MKKSKPIDSIFTLSSKFTEEFNLTANAPDKVEEHILDNIFISDIKDAEKMTGATRQGAKDQDIFVPNLKMAKKIEPMQIESADPLVQIRNEGEQDNSQNDEGELNASESKQEMYDKKNKKLMSKNVKSKKMKSKGKKMTVAFGKVEDKRQSKETELDDPNHIDIEELDNESVAKTNHKILKNRNQLNPNELFGNERELLEEPIAQSTFLDGQNILYLPTDLLLTIFCQEKEKNMPEFENLKQKKLFLNRILRKYKIKQKVYKSGKIVFVFLNHTFEVIKIKSHGQFQRICRYQNKKTLTFEKEKIRDVFVASLKLN